MKTTIAALVLLLAGCKTKHQMSTKQLKTLEEFNSERISTVSEIVNESKSGISCPKCKEEMWFDLTRILTSYPAQTPTFCKKCGFSTGVVR